MATIRAYTTIEQSRKLAEILPLESADMIYIMYRNGEKPQNGDANLSTVYESNEHKWYWVDIIDESWDMRIGEDIPCWSLAALLDILDYPQLSKDKLGSGKEGWMVSVYPNDCRYDSCWHDNPIDACYEMIIKLHELKML